MMQNSIRTNSLWNVAGNGVYAACQWALVIVLAKLSDPDTVGTFALGIAIAVPVVVLTDLQLRAIQATDATDEYEFGTFVGLRLAGGGLALLIIASVALLFLDHAAVVAVVLVGVGRLVESLSEITHGLMQKHERMDLAAKGLVARSVLSLLFFAGAFAATESLELALVGYVAGSVLALVGFDGPFARTLMAPEQRWVLIDLASMRRLVALAAPLGVVAMLVALNQHVPRHAIAGVVGEYGLGIFTAVVYLALAAARLVNALCQAVTPRMARAYASGDTSFVRSSLFRLLGLSGGMALAGVAIALVAGPLVLRVVYTADYATHGPLLVAAMAVAVPVYLSTCLSHTMTSIRALRVQLPLLVSVFAVTLAVSVASVPSLGVLGGVVALGAGATVQAVGSGYVVARRLRAQSGCALAST